MFLEVLAALAAFEVLKHVATAALKTYNDWLVSRELQKLKPPPDGE